MTITGLRIGRYEVGERLGKGGFGVVHLAHDHELGREVAIKFLRPEYMTRTQVVARFLQEARACAKIGHPGIVTVFEAGLVSGTSTRVDGTAFIVMERLHGESLGQRLKSNGRLPPIAAIGIARQLAAALAVAHEAGIIHRDLKPDNVYLVRDAAVVGGERVKILDFGVAKLADPDETEVHTHSRMMLGTPRYMSPEQARAAGKVDLRTDIYALGCLLYELVCGRPPFGGDIGDIIVAHQTAPITPPRELVSSIPAALDSLIVTMLAKDPEQRPESMRAVDESLDTVFGTMAPKKRAPTDLEDEKTTRKPLPNELLELGSSPSLSPTVTLEPATVMRPPPVAPAERHGLLIRIGIGIAAAVISGLIVYLVLRGKDDATRLEPVRPEVKEIVIPALPNPEIGVRETECKAALGNKLWVELGDCGRALLALHGDGQRYIDLATVESRAEARTRNLKEMLAGGDIKAATATVADIPEGSVYFAEATAAYEAATKQLIGKLVSELDPLASRGDCSRHAARLHSFELLYGSALAERARSSARACKVAVATTSPPPPTTPTPLDACDPKTVSEATDRANNDFVTGNFGAAALTLEKLARCNPALLKKAYLASCRARRFPQAKAQFQQLGRPEVMAQICQKEGFDPRAP